MNDLLLSDVRIYCNSLRYFCQHQCMLKALCEHPRFRMASLTLNLDAVPDGKIRVYAKSMNFMRVVSGKRYSS